MEIKTNKQFYQPVGSHRVGRLNKGVKRSTSPEAKHQRRSERTYSRGTQAKYRQTQLLFNEAGSKFLKILQNHLLSSSKQV
jgi:hypothetical protein